jgi:16S rRNA (guanine966-N2)-methyltransferase
VRIVGGTLRHRQFLAPKGSETRPTSSMLRETLFNICQGYIQEANFLDLFAGSGAMGLEALSRGASHATFIDSSREAIKCIRQNLDTLELQHQATVLQGDVFNKVKLLIKAGKQYDIIYADPPYEKMILQQGNNDGKRVFYSENILKMIDSESLLKVGGVLFIEEASSTDLEALSLQNLKQINVRRSGSSALYQFST